MKNTDRFLISISALLPLLTVDEAVAFAFELGFEGDQLTGKPNILFILADDMGWKDAGCYGSSYYETPNIDRLAQRGMLFTDAYASAPLCSASRAAILSGWAPARQRLTGVTPHSRDNYSNFYDYTCWTDEPLWRFGSDYDIPIQLGQFRLSTVTIAERLKEAGYATSFFGKWHLGPDKDKGPQAKGFDHCVGVGWRGWPPTYFSPYSRGEHKLENLSPGEEGEYLTDRLTDEAIRWMRGVSGADTTDKESPFFLYLSHFAPHDPFEAKEEDIRYFEERVDPDNPHRNPVYAAMVKSLDDSVGRLLDEIETLGIEQDTLVVFLSDNGGISAKGDHDPVTSNLPLRGEKALLFAGGIRIPWIMSMPGTIAEGAVSHEPIVHTDLYSTFLGLAGLDPDPDHPLDGVSLIEHMTEGTSLKREFITWLMPHWIQAGEGLGPTAVIRRGNWKYFKMAESDPMLFDLSVDIGERKNVIEQNPELGVLLQSLLLKDMDEKNGAMWRPGTR